MTDCSLHRDESSRTGISLFDRLQLGRPYPLSAMLVLTERCNLCCPHCYVPKPITFDELDLKELTDILDQSAALGVLRLVLTGGEPTLRPDLVDIVDAAVQRRFALTLKTNGTRLSQENVEYLYHAGLQEMNISLYHTDPAQHDAFVGESGAFFKAVGAMEQFSALGGDVHVSIVVMNWNCDNILGLVDFAEQKGWSRNVDLRVMVRTDGNFDPIAQRAQEEALIELVSNERFFDAEVFRDKEPPPSNTPLCTAGRGTICIMPNGDVQPCVSLPWVMGNIHLMSLKDILETSSTRMKLIALQRKDAKQCGECPNGAVCARCPAAAYLENGDINKPSPLDCRNARVWSEARKRWGASPERNS